MSPEPYELLELLDAVANYAVDQSADMTIVLGGQPEVRLDEKTFFDQLYVLRDGGQFEAELVRQILHGRGLICLAAERGRGKTSTLRYALNAVRTGGFPFRIILFDVAAAYGASGFGMAPMDRASDALSNALRTQVLMSLFPRVSDARALYSWCLAGSPDDSDRFSEMLVAGFYEQSTLVLQAVRDPDADRRSRFEQVTQYLADHPEVMQRLLTEIGQCIRLPQIVQAAISIDSSIEKVVLTVDNIDRLPPRVHPALYSELVDAQRAVPASLAVVVAVRSENIRFALTKADSGARFPTYVDLGAEWRTAGLMPETRDEDIAHVLQRRLSYARGVIRAVGRGEEVETPLEVSALLGEGGLAEVVAGGVVEQAVHRLANGSLRATMGLYTEFLRYLWLLRSQADVRVTAYDEAHLATLLYLFLREAGQSFGLELSEVPVPHVPEEARGEFADFAPVRFLLLTGTSNLGPLGTRKQESHLPLPVSELVRAVEELGFPRETILQALMALSSYSQESGAEIEVLGDESDCTETALFARKVKLTLKGRELIENLYWKVGFFWWSAAKELSTFQRGRRPRGYMDFSREQQEEALRRFVTSRAQSELRLMSMLGRTWRDVYGPDWLARYRMRFGVSGRLPVELMLDSLRKFFVRPGDRAPEPFAVLVAQYRELLARVAADPHARDIRFGGYD